VRNPRRLYGKKFKKRNFVKEIHSPAGKVGEEETGTLALKDGPD